MPLVCWEKMTKQQDVNAVEFKSLYYKVLSGAGKLELFYGTVPTYMVGHAEFPT